jgi:TonB family protein
MALSIRFNKTLSRPPVWRRVIVPFEFSAENLAHDLILEAGQVDQAPVLLTKESEITGTDKARTDLRAARVSFVVSSDGRVSSPTVVVATDPAAAKECLAVVREWRFRPAVRGGNPVWCREVATVFLPQFAALPDRGIVPVGAVVDGNQLPVLKKGSPVDYPESLQGKSLRGLVVLKFKVMPNGKVADAVAVASNHPAFAKSAVSAIRDWRFEPAKKDGIPVEMEVQIPVFFDIWVWFYWRAR